MSTPNTPKSAASTPKSTKGTKREREPPLAAGRTPNVLMIGTGEYTTGFVGTGAADSDKGTGVVALVMLDLQRRGKVGRLGMCGTNGKRNLPQIRAHMQRDGVFARSDSACPFFVLPVRDELSENERRDGTQPRALGAGPLLHGPPRAAQSGTHRRWLSPQLPSHWAAAAGGG